MGKLIRYEMLHAVDHGTNENSDIQQTRIPAEIICNTQAQFDANYPIAEKEAIPGTIEVTGAFDHVTAPHNIEAGEYVTIEGVLYLATENIPNGEPIIVGQNAVQTSIEEQLREMKGE